jgi:hypothetical protein
LEEFGIRCGTRIEMFRAGTPCILRIGGNKFCLRADELLDVLVEPITAKLRPHPKKNPIQLEGMEMVMVKAEV